MKNLISLMAVLLVASAAVPASAATVTAQQMNQIAVQTALASIHPADLINWKVGDTNTYSVTIGSFGALGSMVNSVTKDEGTAIWLHEELNLMVQKQTVDTLINKADGKVLKILVNGQEQQIPDNDIEIISQDYTEITVKAGTFKVIHVVAKSSQVDHIEIWANPRDIPIDGAAKESMSMQFGDMVMELQSFTRGN
jgi:hypothetical protein